MKEVAAREAQWPRREGFGGHVADLSLHRGENERTPCPALLQVRVGYRALLQVWVWGSDEPSHPQRNSVERMLFVRSWALVGSIHGVPSSGRAAAGAHVVPRMQAADAAASLTWSLFSGDKVCAKVVARRW